MGNKAFKLLTKAFNLTYRFTVKKKNKKTKTKQNVSEKKRKETEQNAGALAKKTKKKTKKQRRRRRRRNGLRPPVSCDGDSGYLVSISTGIFGLSFFFFSSPTDFVLHTDFRPIQSDSARIGPV